MLPMQDTYNGYKQVEVRDLNQNMKDVISLAMIIVIYLQFQLCMTIMKKSY